MKVTRKVQFKTNEICVGDRITVRLSGFGKFTATAQRVTDKGILFLFDEVIARHLPVTTEFITQEEAQGRFDLKRLPDSASETVRVVKVGDYDECLCIGAHVENTSEIGTFKIISHDWDEEAKRWRMRFKLV